jgi:hypothetical protein
MFPVAASFFCFPWEDLNLTTWAAPTFTTSPNMSLEVGQPVAAIATTQVKLCPYDEEELAIRFHLIKAQFASVGIKTQNLKYANTLVSLPKQGLQDILDTVDVYNNSDQPFNLLKTVLLGQFGNGSCRSYFELLRLPLEMQGLKPSILMGKLEQHLSHGVSPDTDLLLSIFLIWLPRSMREAAGAGNHKMAKNKVIQDLRYLSRRNHPTVEMQIVLTSHCCFSFLC